MLTIKNTLPHDIHPPVATAPAESPVNFTEDELERYLFTIDEHLIRQKQLPPNLMMDDKFLPALIALANQKYPDLNLHFEVQAPNFGERVRQLTQEPDSSARLIVNMGKDGIHFAAFDISRRNDHISVIGIEPATLRGSGPALLALRSQGSLNRELPNASFVVIESDLQRSDAECGIFSLALAKKMAQEKAAFEVLHDRNRAGELQSPDFLISRKLLPPLLMKHAQSERRLGHYLEALPEAARLTVNKRGETLQDRQSRHVVDTFVDGKRIRYSTSIEVKRRYEINHLLNRIRQDKAAAQGASPAAAEP